MSPQSRAMHIANYHNLGLDDAELLHAISTGSQMDVAITLFAGMNRADTAKMLKLARGMAS